MIKVFAATLCGFALFAPISASVIGQFQAAVMYKRGRPGQDYRPGNIATLSFGLGYSL